MQKKFRAFDKYTNKMIVTGFHVFGEVTLFNLIGQYLYENPRPEQSGTLLRYDDVEVMQWSGLKDQKLSDIYEDDIVSVEYGLGRIVFNAGCFMIQWIDDKEANMEELGYYRKNGHSRRVIEILGNIWENPKLLTK